MRVHLIRKETLEDFTFLHARSTIPIEDWLEKLKNANWMLPEDIKRTYGSADLLGRGSNKVVFDIGGNNYRMICKYVFGKKNVHLFICWIGKHSDYDQLCKEVKQYTINLY